MKEPMKNVTMAVDGDVLTIKVDLKARLGESSSGKTTIVATTEGNTDVPGHAPIKIGLNVYLPKPKG